MHLNKVDGNNGGGRIGGLGNSAIVCVTVAQVASPYGGHEDTRFPLAFVVYRYTGYHLMYVHCAC